MKKVLLGKETKKYLLEVKNDKGNRDGIQWI